MAVGAGSIKRASKLSTEAVEEKKTTAEKTAPKKATATKATTTKAATKTATKKAPAKKTTQSKVVEQKPAEAVSSVNATPAEESVAGEKAVLVMESKKKNQACRLTEEMPVYLL